MAKERHISTANDSNIRSIIRACCCNAADLLPDARGRVLPGNVCMGTFCEPPRLGCKLEVLMNGT